MSYPPTIQALVIEDDQRSKDHYEAIFQQLRTEHAIAAPQWAFCFNDGVEALREERIYHLVIVDLRLPEDPGQPPAESLDFGRALISECANRDPFPVPALLVITGHLNQTRQQELDAYVRSSFAYGRVIAKSENLEIEIAQALLQIPRYLRVGIHVRDSENSVFPTITPREEDLLRRCILKNVTFEGLDLAWWTASYNPHVGWVKVLMGRFLLEGGLGPSLYSFFKLATAEGFENVFRDASIMTNKLKHVKIIYSQSAGQRSLLVTQSAGSGLKAPSSLSDILARPKDKVATDLPRVATSIVDQVAALGSRTPDQKPIRQLLWTCHDRARIKSQWERRSGPTMLGDYGIAAACPVELFSELAADDSVVRYDVQSVLHGDLNCTNVAVDEDASGINVFIFDASGIRPGVCTNDVAMLEVTLLLHQHSDEQLVKACAGLYTADWRSATAAPDATDRQTNTFEFVKSLRSACLAFAPVEIYALTVLDHALLQLGGLDFGSSHNKIYDPTEACRLAAFTAGWYVTLRNHHQ